MVNRFLQIVASLCDLGSSGAGVTQGSTMVKKICLLLRCVVLVWKLENTDSDNFTISCYADALQNYMRKSSRKFGNIINELSSWLNSAWKLSKAVLFCSFKICSKDERMKFSDLIIATKPFVSIKQNSM